ncbi:MAG TPA: protein kinase [Polyangiales bacterium]|nr:protein kinase [Polyangiales bacterium]
MELAEGLILDGHYRLRQLLGRGGMGEVWEAEHTRLPKLFAVKFLLALGKSEPELLMRFQREAEIASRLNHPSIVQVTDFNILPDGTAYIAMERLVGEDLRARLRRGPLPLGEAREITRQVASALWLTHQQGIVHRDLKPENIFLCHEPDGSLRAKVLDFGISKLQGTPQGTRDDRVLGTPGYMAPEQALGKNSAIDGRTDLFALATIVYEMLTGEGVFMGDTLAELCTKVLYHEPPLLDSLLPAVPRPISLAVSRALSKDPAQRQADIRVFSDAVLGLAPRATSAFSATVASEVGPVPIDVTDVKTRSERPQPASPSQPVRRKRMLSAGLGAAAVALVIGVAAWVQMRAVPVAPAQAPSAPPLPSAEPVAEPPTQAEAHAETPPPVETKRSDRLDPGALSKKKPALPDSAREALDAAEKALDQGQPGDALRFARASLREGPSERAYALLARAYCVQRDLGMVQAMLRNLSPAQRKQVKTQCARSGLELP